MLNLSRLALSFAILAATLSASAEATTYTKNFDQAVLQSRQTGKALAIPADFTVCRVSIKTGKTVTVGDVVVRVTSTDSYSKNDLGYVFGGPYTKSAIYQNFNYDTQSTPLCSKEGTVIKDNNGGSYWVSFTNDGTLKMGLGDSYGAQELVSTNNVKMDGYSYIGFSSWGGDCNYEVAELSCDMKDASYTMPTPTPTPTPTPSYSSSGSYNMPPPPPPSSYGNYGIQTGSQQTGSQQTGSQQTGSQQTSSQQTGSQQGSTQTPGTYAAPVNVYSDSATVRASLLLAASLSIFLANML